MSCFLDGKGIYKFYCLLPYNELGCASAGCQAAQASESTLQAQYIDIEFVSRPTFYQTRRSRPVNLVSRCVIYLLY